MKKELIDLYNGIMNDASIRNFTVTAVGLAERISKRYKSIEKSEIKFSGKLVISAISVTSGKLKSDLIAFGREIQINMATLGIKDSIR